MGAYIVGGTAIVSALAGIYIGVKADNVLDSLGFEEHTEEAGRLPSFVVPSLLVVGAVYYGKRKGII